jgi:hypothetical protein
MNTRSKKELWKKDRDLIKIVKDVIDEWDPIELLSFCPPDEYKMEIESVTTNILKETSEDDLARKIHSIFTKSFGSDVFTKDIDECRKVAIIIRQKLKNIKQ